MTFDDFIKKNISYLCAAFFAISIILVIVFSVHYEETHCNEVTITYNDGTIEVLHCTALHERSHYILIDYDRKIILSSIREYTSEYVKCIQEHDKC